MTPRKKIVLRKKGRASGAPVQPQPDVAKGSPANKPARTQPKSPAESKQSKSFKFFCIRCGHKLEVERSGAGRQVPCPECGNRITIPKPLE